MESVLCHVRKDGRILLQRKASGLFGEGKWNAAGGKINEKETPEQAAMREMREETGLDVRNLKKHGVLEFFYTDKSDNHWFVHLFSTPDFSGEPTTESEGELKWFSEDDIPYEKMWPDDEFWLPLMLQDKRFNAKFFFKADTIVNHEIELVG